MGFVEDYSPAELWENRATQRVLDDLFCSARQYRSSQFYGGLLKFVAGFRFTLPTMPCSSVPRCQGEVRRLGMALERRVRGELSRRRHAPW